MAGSALIWNGGHYRFGNADQNSLANQNNLGNEILQNHEERQEDLQQRRNAKNDGVFVNEESDLLKKRRGKPAYDVDNYLLKEKGLDLIMKHCKDWKFKGKGHERSDLKRLIQKYEEWAFIMYKPMRFEDIVKKTLTFSSKQRVKNHLQRLRDQRDGVQVIGDEVKEEDMEMDVDIVMDHNDDIANNRNINRPQGQLQRHPDEEEIAQLQPNQTQNNNDNYVRNSDLGPVLEARGNRANNTQQVANNATNNNNNNNNANPSDNYNDGSRNFWGDPMDMMDFGPPPDEYDIDRDIERAMYG